MRVVILEDDSEQFDAVTEKLRDAFPGLVIDHVRTEYEFRCGFGSLKANPPDALIVDVMLRWTDASTDYQPMPPEIRADHGHFRAGLRCAAMMATDERTRDVPVVVYSVLDRADLLTLPIGVVHARKTDSAGDLVRSLRSLWALAGTRPSYLDSTDSSPQSAPRSGQREAVFISYSHKDRQFLNELLEHLRPYVRSTSLSVWSDQQLQPGSQWFDDIRKALRGTKVGVFLVSKAFLASDFIHTYEFSPLLKSAEHGAVTLLWIPVRASS
jgi:hypothetical protein